MTWIINGQLFSALALTNVNRERFNLATDRITFIADGRLIDAAAIFAYDAPVTILRDGQPFFAGRAGRAPISGTPSAENHAYEILGPWDQLERLVYQQTWVSGSETGDPPVAPCIAKSRVILGQSASGSAQTIAEVITDILTFAIEQAGVALQLGTIVESAKPPFAEVLDVSCAEAIRNVAQYSPTGVAWINYTTTPPSFNFAPRASLSAVTLALTALESVNITQAVSQVVPAVVLKAEKTNETDGQTWESIETQKYPPGATEIQVGAVVQTLQLAGARSSSIYQHVTVAAVPNFIPDDTLALESTAAKWWLRRHPELANYAAYSLRNMTRQAPEVDYPNELREGVIQDWMTRFTDDSVDPATAKDIAVREDVLTVICTYVMLDDEGAVCRVEETTLTEKIQVTNITPTPSLAYPDADGIQTGTRKFRRLSEVVAEETLSTGLAQALYDALNVPQWQGTLSLIEEEVTGTIGPGKLLNITGGAAAWATMRATVQSVQEHLDTGTTTIQIGTPNHLTLSTIMALRRANRTRKPADSWAARVSGLSGDLGRIDLGSTRPTFEPTASARRTFRLRIDHNQATNPNPPIILDPATNPPDTTYKVFQVMADGTTGFDFVRAHA